MKLQEFLNSDVGKELVDRAKTFKNVEEAMAFAKENNIEITEAEAKKYITNSDSKRELSEEDLDKITGGGLFDAGSMVDDGSLNINNNDPRCPECQNQLNCIEQNCGCTGTHYDKYQCVNCQVVYKHYWADDEWFYY